MKTNLIAFLFVGLGACSNYNFGPDTNLEALTYGDELDVLVTSNLHPAERNGVAATDNCITIDDSTTLTVNGIPGTLVTAGGLPFDADSCESPTLQLKLAPLPPTLDVVVDDGTTALHMGLLQTSTGTYLVEHCDAASCTTF